MFCAILILNNIMNMKNRQLRMKNNINGQKNIMIGFYCQANKFINHFIFFINHVGRSLLKRMRDQFQFYQGDLHKYILLEYSQMVYQMAQLNNYISSMTFFPSYPQSMQILMNPTLSLHRHVRIKSSKLPPDFFTNITNNRINLSPFLVRRNDLDLSTRDIRTPCFDTRKIEPSTSDSERYQSRKAETARVVLGKIQDENSFTDSAPSSKRLRSLIRRKSIDLKNGYNIDIEQRDFRLPKLLSRGKSAQKSNP